MRLSMPSPSTPRSGRGSDGHGGVKLQSDATSTTRSTDGCPTRRDRCGTRPTSPHDGRDGSAGSMRIRRRGQLSRRAHVTLRRLLIAPARACAPGSKTGALPPLSRRVAQAPRRASTRTARRPRSPSPPHSSRHCSLQRPAGTFSEDPFSLRAQRAWLTQSRASTQSSGLRPKNPAAAPREHPPFPPAVSLDVSPPTATFDVVVFAATPGGVAAAVAAARGAEPWRSSKLAATWVGR